MLQGGNLDWITQGLKAVDPLVARFSEVNEVLAYVPWRLHIKHVEALLQKDEGGRSWSIR